jgi:hypothetical protein
MGCDSDVVIARIKNRFDPNIDSAPSAGYRNLAVNLRLVTTETKSLGIETHVCEVQLILLRMAIIKVMDILSFIFFCIFVATTLFVCPFAYITSLQNQVYLS